MKKVSSLVKTAVKTFKANPIKSLVFMFPWGVVCGVFYGEIKNTLPWYLSFLIIILAIIVASLYFFKVAKRYLRYK